jgi:hypothetical protein
MPPKIALVPAPAPSQVTPYEFYETDATVSLPPIKMRKSAIAAPSEPVSEPAPVPSLPTPVPVKKSGRKPKLSPLRENVSQESQETTPDVSTTLSRRNDLLALLEQKGYQVLAKIMEGSVLRALKVTNVYGEWVMLLLDKKAWQNLAPDSHDIVWTSSPAQVGIPEVAKTGYVATVDPTATGVAIEQGPDLSLLLREGLESVPTETTFSRKDGTGKSITAYPVLKVSDLLQSPELASKRIHDNTMALQVYSRRLADTGVANALEKLHKITSMLETYHKSEGSVLKRLDATYRQLVEWYDAYQAMEQTPETLKKQNLVSSNIRVRQDAMRRLLRSSQMWTSDKVHALLQDLESNLEEDLRYLTGIEKGINYIMTE